MKFDTLMYRRADYGGGKSRTIKKQHNIYKERLWYWKNLSKD